MAAMNVLHEYKTPLVIEIGLRGGPDTYLLYCACGWNAEITYSDEEGWDVRRGIDLFREHLTT